MPVPRRRWALAVAGHLAGDGADRDQAVVVVAVSLIGEAGTNAPAAPEVPGELTGGGARQSPSAGR